MKYLLRSISQAICVTLILTIAVDIQAQQLKVENVINSIGKMSSVIHTEIRNNGYRYDRLAQNRPCTIHKKVVEDLEYLFMICDKGGIVFELMYNEDLKHQSVIYEKIISLGFEEVVESGLAAQSHNKNFINSSKNMKVSTDADVESEILFVVVKSLSN